MLKYRGNRFHTIGPDAFRKEILQQTPNECFSKQIDDEDLGPIVLVFVGGKLWYVVVYEGTQLQRYKRSALESVS